MSLRPGGKAYGPHHPKTGSPARGHVRYLVVAPIMIAPELSSRVRTAAVVERPRGGGASKERARDAGVRLRCAPAAWRERQRGGADVARRRSAGARRHERV